MEIRILLALEDTVPRGEEGGGIRLEGRCKVFGVKSQFSGVRGDLLEAGASFLHQVQLGEDIGNEYVVFYPNILPCKVNGFALNRQIFLQIL